VLCDSDKSRVAKGIVRAIRTRGGRFLKKDEKTGEWTEIGDAGKQGAITKAAQALREKQIALKNQIDAFGEGCGSSISTKQFSDEEFYQYSLYVLGKIHGEPSDLAALPASVKEMIEVSKLEERLAQQLKELDKRIEAAAAKDDYITAGQLQAYYKALTEGKKVDKKQDNHGAPQNINQEPLEIPLMDGHSEIGETPEGNVTFVCNYCNWASEPKPAKTKRLKCKRPGCETYEKLRAVYKVRRKGGKKDAKITIYTKKTKHWTLVPAPSSAKPAGLDRLDDQGLAVPALDIPAPPGPPGLPNLRQAQASGFVQSEPKEGGEVAV